MLISVCIFFWAAKIIGMVFALRKISVILSSLKMAFSVIGLMRLSVFVIRRFFNRIDLEKFGFVYLNQ